VDLVEGYAEIKDRIQKLVSVEIPELELCDVMTLEVKGSSFTFILSISAVIVYYLVQCYYLLYYFYICFTEEKRDIEVDAVSAADVSISLDQGVTTSTLPNSLKLLRSVDVSNHCYSVCRCKGNTYVGIYGGGVARVDENYNVTQSFVAVSGTVFGLTAYKDQLYALVYACEEDWKVEVYDLSGNQVTSWTHWDDVDCMNTLAIVDGQVVVPDRPSRRLTIYSLAGEVIKHVPCSLLLNSYAPICAADRHCVVVTDYNSSQIVKLDLTTEKVIWTCKDVPSLGSATCYRSKYILVTNYSSKTTIWILDVKTG